MCLPHAAFVLIKLGGGEAGEEINKEIEQGVEMERERSRQL